MKMIIEPIEDMSVEEMIEILVDAINQGTKKFGLDEAPFLHEAMEKYFEWKTGIKIEDLEGINE